MKKLTIYLVFQLVIIGTTFGQSEKLADHVILISIDGFRPDFYLESKWNIPTIKYMSDNGVNAKGVRGVFPSVTYPSHSTIITGALPSAHGIYYNTPFEVQGQTGKWYWYTDMFKTPTLWHAVKAKGMTSASFLWPVSVGAPIDYNIPEIWNPAEGFTGVEIMRNNETPAGLMAEMEIAVLGKMGPNTFSGDYLNREDRTGEMAAYILEKYKPDFMSVHLIAVDHFQHLEGRDGIMVNRALSASDRAVGKILEAAQRAGIMDKTTFIIVGDHGFVNIHTSISPNIWLVNAGLMEDKQDRGNWKATFFTSGASAFLHLNDKNDKTTLAKVRALIEELPYNYKKLFRVVERDELDIIGADPNTEFALAPIPGVTFSQSTSGNILKSAKGGTHGFFPEFQEIESGFIAWGAGISNVFQIQKMGIEDIAPVISQLLNLDFEPVHGTLYPGIISKNVSDKR